MSTDKVQRAFWVSRENFELITRTWKSEATLAGWPASLMTWVGKIVIDYCKRKEQENERTE